MIVAANKKPARADPKQQSIKLRFGLRTADKNSAPTGMLDLTDVISSIYRIMGG